MATVVDEGAAQRMLWTRCLPLAAYVLLTSGTSLALLRGASVMRPGVHEADDTGATVAGSPSSMLEWQIDGVRAVALITAVLGLLALPPCFVLIARLRQDEARRGAEGTARLTGLGVLGASIILALVAFGLHWA